MSRNIATAYIKLMPSTEGIKAELEKILGDAGASGGEEGGKKAGAGMSKGLATTAKVVGAGVAAAGAAVLAVGKQAVSAYAEYEQLVGGVETLFGGSADTIMAYAQNAYKTAGLSANEYMETSTSFAASLLQGLGGDTEAAANMADLAITDMADNANKMGTSMESIQNAYQGFAKQNYTMLDNLKLGYGGTQAEMVRLINDSGVLNEEISSMDGISFDTIVSAIHAVQENMGITGTTAAEAMGTISGSVAMTKSAWDNLLVGLADGNQEIGPLIDNLVEAGTAAFNNILPVAEEALVGIAGFVDSLAPIIEEQLPGILSTALPAILDSGASILMALINGILGALPTLVEQVPTIITNIVDTLAANLPQIITMAFQIIGTLASGLVNNLPTILSAVWNLGVAIVQGVWSGIKSMWSTFWANVSGFFSGIVNGVKSLLGIASPSKVFREIGGYTMQGLDEGIAYGADTVQATMRRAVNGALGEAERLTATADIRATAASVQIGSQNSLYSLLDGLRDDIRSMKIYLDGRVIAGYVDTALAQRNISAGRGVVYA